MSIYALADLHLGFEVDKTMDMFGAQWVDHTAKIKKGWRSVVGEDDTVLIAGDISWAMRLNQAGRDIKWIHDLPGRKVMIRGNHDYWWDGITKLRAAMPPSITLLQNDHCVVEDCAIAGARGWNTPAPNQYTKDIEKDIKIFNKERRRLELSLKHAAQAGLPIIAMMHFPPFIKGSEHADFTDILEKYEVRAVVYGHYHGADHKLAFQGMRNGIRYIFCAADSVDFTPVPVFFEDSTD